jgi:predicted acyltransferase
MTEVKIPSPGSIGDRLMSLDFFRGFTMFLLIAEGTKLFKQMVTPELEGTLLFSFGQQFHHHAWNGLHFWDLVQPFFMFIVGVAIPLSVAKRMQRGDSYADILKHAGIRSITLLILGVMIPSIARGEITLRFQNVLAQLSVTYMIAIVLMRRSTSTQVIVSLSLILITDLLYRFFPVAGYNQPFEPDKNFGAFIDMMLSGQLSSGHWVSFNAIPTTAHTIWGVLAGQLLMSDRKYLQKLKILIVAGVICLIAGYSLDPVIPIIKRICTSSFIFASGGWCLLALAFSYWLIDIKGTGKWPRFFAIVGMNPLFIYMFAQVGGSALLYRISMPISHFMLSWAGERSVLIVNGMLTWGLLWYICYWLYKRKIFIRI